MKVEVWSLKEKVGQMFIIAFAGEEMTEELKQAIIEWNVGGVILFQRNLRDNNKVVKLNKQIQALASEHNRPPLWISIDQEGGGISYLWEGMVLSPGNMIIAATGEAQYAYDAAKVMGEQLIELGFTMNYAPNIDVNNNPANPVIGARAFSDSPQEVSIFGKHAVSGYHDAGVIAVAKHFPGHGDTATDSHLGLPVVNKSLEELEQHELLPFKENIEEGLDAIMTAHIVFPAIDKKYPATLSKTILTDLLRETYQFKGLIITDSMEMDAIAKFYGREEGTVKAIQAGADIILACGQDLTSQSAMMERVIQAVFSGELDEAVVNVAVERILFYKDKWMRKEQMGAHSSLAFKKQKEHYRKQMLEIAEAGVTLQRNERGLIPILGHQKVKVISQQTYNDENYMGDRRAIVEYVFNDGNYEVVYLEKEKPSLMEMSKISESLELNQTVLFLINERRTLGEEWAMAYQKISEKTDNIIVVSLWNPQIVHHFPKETRVESYIATYSNTEEVIYALKSLIEGEKPFKGIAPVSLIHY
ncbi:beta-N-acetylhexosaminidase [Alkalihalobacillus sp. 1P02AB]|uniref:beta-N-acetylhexosaminidase n=1 Tax=Alkalihalobacillus sp. 1P02AB TaxID=3132260 RepID=UPI0039A6C77F